MSFSYLPDLPPETPEVWTVCDGFHPDVYGNYRSGWYAATLTTNTLDDRNFQSGFAYKTAAGLAGALLASAAVGTRYAYVWDGTSWTDRVGTAAGLIKFTGMVQVGNTTLLAGDSSGSSIYYRDATGTSNFAAVTGSPTTGQKVLMVGALNIVMGLGGSAFATSDTNNPTVWNSGEAASGNVWLTPGNFTAGVALGNDFICFKDRGVYRASYVGGTVKWTFTLIDPEKGAWGPGCAVLADGKVIFIGSNGVYSFDGASFQKLDYGIWQALVGHFGKTGQSDADKAETALIWDPHSRNVFFFQQGSGLSVSIHKFFTYNTVSQKWGYQSRFTDAGTESFRTVFDVGALNDYATAAFGPTYKTNVGVLSATNDVLKVLHTVFNATDVPGTNYKPKLRTSRIGKRGRMTKITRVIPQWTLSDGIGSSLSTATVKNCVPYYSQSPMEAEVAGTTVTLSTDLYRADTVHSDRFQSFELQVNAEAVISGVEVEAQDAGRD